LDRRLIIILGGLPVGLIVGSLLWLATGGANAPGRSVEAISSSLGTAPKGLMALRGPTGVLAGSLVSKPLFVLTTGPGAMSDVGVRLIGVAITPRGRSALVSIDNGAPEWVALGDTKHALTLVNVSAASIGFDTPLGPKTVSFADQAAPASSAPAQAVPSVAAIAPQPTPPGSPKHP